MKPIISISGLYRYDETIFDNLRVPTQVDKEVLIDMILSELFEVEVLYPNPDMMRRLIGSWSITMIDEWQHLADMLDTKYNPLTRKETFIDKESRDIDTTSDGSSSGNSNHNVAGFNNLDSSNLVPQTSDISNLSSNARSNESGNIDRSRTAEYIGPTGKLTTGTIIEQEINARSIDIYNIIVDEFKLRFCLMVY